MWLSQWNRIYDGGKCPTRECIPLTDDLRFNHFITRLFCAVLDFSMGFCDMLGCVLLLCHFDGLAEFPAHPYC